MPIFPISAGDTGYKVATAAVIILINRELDNIIYLQQLGVPAGVATYIPISSLEDALRQDCGLLIDTPPVVSLASPHDT